MDMLIAESCELIMCRCHSSGRIKMILRSGIIGPRFISATYDIEGQGEKYGVRTVSVGRSRTSMLRVSVRHWMPMVATSAV